MAHISEKRMELRADDSSTAAEAEYVSNGTQSIASLVDMKPGANQRCPSRMMKNKKNKEMSGGAIRDDEKSKEKKKKPFGTKEKSKENNHKNWTKTGKMQSDQLEVYGKESAGMDGASADRSKENHKDLDVIRGVQRLHMYIDNTISRISFRPVNDYEIWEPIRVIVDPRGRTKITGGEEFGEVYSARIIDLGGKSSRRIHGQILLKCGLGDTYLFRRNKENPLTISCGQEDMLPLAGPIVATFGEDWDVMIILKEGEEEFCRGLIIVCPPDYFGVKYNQPMTRKFRGNSGSTALEVICASYTDAVLAEVEIKLIEDRNTPCKIFGSITAKVDNEKKLTSKIFDKTVDQSVTLVPGQVIPLSRPLLSVPRSSYLLIKVDLWDSDSSPHKPLVRGSLRFTPEYFGGDPWTLPDKFPKIDVKVTWLSFRDHEKSMDCFWPHRYRYMKVDVNELCPDMEGTI